MKIVVAPNAFKNALTAMSAAQAISEGIGMGYGTAQCILFPVGDGGDGTGELLCYHLSARRVNVRALDPLGREIETSFGLIDDTAIIEMADISGLRLLQPSEYDPLSASSFGTGQLMLAALNHHVRRIILAIGGSATVDGGVGLMQALGAAFKSPDDTIVVPFSSELEVASIDVDGLDPRLNGCEIIVLTDVSNPLLGEKGAARCFGPQKGADGQMVLLLEKRLQSLADALKALKGFDVGEIPRGGAAGGVAAILTSLAGARLVNGIEYFLDLTDFGAVVDGCDLVITGEGSLDEQTLWGKAPFGVAQRAKRAGKKVIAFAGKVAPPSERLHKHFDEIIEITPRSASLDDALGNAYKNLVNASEDFGRRLSSL